MGRVEWARALAERLPAEPLPRRWAHTQGVAAAAGRLAPILGEDAELIEAAAWLHDIGYSPVVADTGFHPLDGARYLRDVESADALPCGLVAYHTGAVYEAQERGLESSLGDEFTLPARSLAVALTYCDVTTGPDGNSVTVQERIDDILERYGPDHPVGRALRKAQSFYLDIVSEIEACLTSRTPIGRF
ncbi:HD domain-containing protein [Pseudonocardia acaciae]|uniref:HD domain-containing protein n=1 Tax=Pseudonocardia acaciae TaxID=551276 RepID=UPI0007E8E107|nr:HD domain-containing protein [Pseudonocardia acaciae]